MAGKSTSRDAREDDEPVLTAPPRRARRLGSLALAGALAVPALGLAAAGPAQAAEYRYWSFWDAKDGAWSYATEGPATARPADGDVAGFRFTVGADATATGKPRAAADFGAICAGTPAQEGRKRVALVLDFGTAVDAPKGETPPPARKECARVAPDASAADALATVAKPLRYNSAALLCAIAGYPRTGCADKAEASGNGAGNGSAAPSTSASPSGDTSDADGGGPSAGLIGGIAAVVVLGAAALWQARRRRG
ncbi:SCO2322 family protein [Streptomyces sp. NPDC003077]|uniref:SCO2322 family protein n=1 Tax=Streptomyces sp. NPDC003077 TaxID=3154443 RepID=UPI0033BB65EF